MRARLGVDQLHVDAHALAAALNAALEHVAHVQVLPDLTDVDRLPSISEGGVAGDDEGARDARKVGGQTVGDPVDEILLLRPAAEIGEGEHDHRYPRRSALQRRGGRRRVVRAAGAGATA